MSEQEFELYLKLLSRCLGLTANQREQISDELRDHLLERLEELAHSGVPRDQAVLQAIDEFGDAAVLAGHFTTVARLKRRRLLMRLSLSSVAALAAGIVIAFAFWPQNGAVQGPPQIAAQEKTKLAIPPTKPSGTTLVASRASVGPAAKTATPPEPILQLEVCRPIPGEVRDRYQTGGAIKPSQLVQIRSLAGGYLQKILFRAGQSVKRGDLLFEIDSRLRAAELNKAEAEVSRAEARLRHTTAEWEPMKKLQQQGLATTEALSRIEGERDTAQADLQAAKANAEIARLQLSYARITAPIDGRISAPSIDVGNLIKADESNLATLSCFDPTYVTFPVDRTTWLWLRKAITQPKEPVSVEIFPHGDQDRKIGTVDSLNDSFDLATSTIQVHAVVPNPDRLLIPGLYVSVALTVGDPYKALLVPCEAMGRDKQGFPCVYVVTEQHVLESRLVTCSPIDGSRAIKAGLKAEDWVVMHADRCDGISLGRKVEPKPVEWSRVRKTAGSP